VPIEEEEEYVGETGDIAFALHFYGDGRDWES
jgi:hypothetical protein